MPDLTPDIEQEERHYQYSGVPLMPEAITALILELYSGKIVRRNDIVNSVPKVHVSRGGASAVSSNLTSAVKKSLQNLKREGLATNPGYGMWKISSSTDEDTTEESQTYADDQTEENSISADLIFGDGVSAIYLYYFEAYQSHPDAQEDGVWPCKIGRTDRDPLQRILSQSTTALPEVPHISFVMKTPFPSQWETALHSILRLRGQAIKTAPGNEWFSTNPSEVLNLIRWIAPDLEVPPMS